MEGVRHEICGFVGGGHAEPVGPDHEQPLQGRLLITANEENTTVDQNRVFYFDLPVR